MTGNTDFEARRGDNIAIDLNQPLNLQIHNHSGDVTVRAVDRHDVLINADEHGYFGSGDDSTFVIDVDQNRIRIQTSPGQGAGWPGMSGDIDAFVGQITRAFRRGGSPTAFRPGRARGPMGHLSDSDVAVEIPRSMTGRIEVQNASGDVLVDGFNGDVQLTTVSGDLRLLRIRGELTLQTTSGDVIAEGGAGRVTAHTTSGDIRVESAQCESFHLQTANGDIGVDTMFGGGPFRAQTANGDVRLTLRRPVAGVEEGATLAFRAISGEAHVSPPFRKIDQRRWQMGQGDGGPTIEVMTVSGDLTVDVAAATDEFRGAPPRPASPYDVPPAPPVPEPPEPPEPPVAPPAPAWRSSESAAAAPSEPDTAPQPGPGESERLAVLAAVERGEIDVEEALRRLEAADGSPAQGND